MTSIFGNIKRGLTAIENGLQRLIRSKYNTPAQYPEIIPDLQETIENIQLWLENRKLLMDQGLGVHLLIFSLFGELKSLIDQFWVHLKPAKGVKLLGKKLRIRQQEKLTRSIDSALEKILKALNDLKYDDSEIHDALDKGLEQSFVKEILRPFQRKVKYHIIQRGEKTYIIRCPNPKEYDSLVKNRKKLRAEVLPKLPKGDDALGHKRICKGCKEYVLAGKRMNPRSTIVGGKKTKFDIRMVKCKICDQRFSLLPSFLPREKNYGIDTIGIVCRALSLRSNSILSVLEQTEHLGRNRVKSRQTIIDWMRWMGTLHPAAVLTRAGIQGTGYLQEDEGFEKEPNLRTYSVVMVDPKTQLVWHSDYVDHVDEATLTRSFKEFLEHISFKILGVAKDKWLPSTKALKNVFYKVWIGYCHRHCLNNFQKALDRYQTETNCSDQERSEIYRKFRKVLKTSTSKVNLLAKARSLKEDAFNHPILAERVSELKENAAHYTSHKNRKEITQTTSIVDNFLKIVKRKLKGVESFRDQETTKLFFKGLANIRNFAPFAPGAKNARKSPFKIAGGETYGLPWAQVMNIHNAFLFSKGESLLNNECHNF